VPALAIEADASPAGLGGGANCRDVFGLYSGNGLGVDAWMGNGMKKDCDVGSGGVRGKT
jgi:hypothetical protein